jgi:hypothetical protein
VTCPTCGAQWFHPETIEFSEVKFRCAKSGAGFATISSRRSPLHKFAIQEVKKATGSEASHAASSVPQRSDPIVPLEAAAPGLRLAGPPQTGLLAKIFRRKVSMALTPQPIQSSNIEQTDVRAHVATRDINDYNWNGFFCPYCKAPSFVHCHACGFLVCDGTIELRSARRFHQCFCGHAAFVGEFIKSIEDTRRSSGLGEKAAKPPTTTDQGNSGKPTGTAVAPLTKNGPPSKR